MIAAVITPGRKPCIVLLTGRDGFKVKSKTYCGREVNASDGVYQLPDSTEVCKECTDKIPAVVEMLKQS